MHRARVFRDCCHQSERYCSREFPRRKSVLRAVDDSEIAINYQESALAF